MLYVDLREMACAIAAITSAIGAGAVLIQHSQVDEACAWRNPFECLAVENAGRTQAVASDETGDVSAVTVLIVGARVSRHEGLLIYNSRQRKNALIKIRVMAHAAIDQRHSDARAGVVRLPGEGCVHRCGGVAERRRQVAGRG